MDYETIKIDQKTVAEQLKQRKNGRKAGRGDSDYTQDEYENIYGLKENKK